MDLLEGIETRRSFRAFKPTPVPRETMEKILKAAGRSPSFTNTQPWEVSVVSGKKKDELSAILYTLADSNAAMNADLTLPTTWPSELERRSGEHGSKRLNALGVAREDKEGRKRLRMMNYEFYGSPCVLLLFMDSTLTPWSVFDMGLFAQTLSLAAHSLGLGSCLQASIAGYPDTIREFLGIPNTKLLMLGISIGYPDYEANINSYHSSRVSLDNFVQWHD
ncbi:nitroreductase [Chloroflexota bacterium]